MARKKEPDLKEKNRTRILQISKELFLKNGIENTRICDIAKAAKMCKSTLYVYYRSKEEIINDLSLEAMEYFYHRLKEQVDAAHMDLHERYMTICQELVLLKENYPMSFELLLEEIRVDEKSLQENGILLKIYEIGEAINRLLYTLFQDGEKPKEEREMFCQVFMQWGSICGLILLADNKSAYIDKSTGYSKEEFLEKGFENLFLVYAAGGKTA